MDDTPLNESYMGSLTLRKLIIVLSNSFFGLTISLSHFAYAQAPVSEPEPVFLQHSSTQAQQYYEERSENSASLSRQEEFMVLLRYVQTLQQEIRELRGQVEVQGHEIQWLKERLQESMSLFSAAAKDKPDRFVQSNAQKASVTEDSWLIERRDSLPEHRSVVVIPEEPEEVYQMAHQILQQGDYALAEEQLGKFVEQYPQHSRVADARYWLGDLALLRNDYEQALTQFRLIEEHHPNFARLPEALLKLGSIHELNGEEELAKQYYIRVQQKAPNSTAARLAMQKLQR